MARITITIPNEIFGRVRRSATDAGGWSESSGMTRGQWLNKMAADWLSNLVKVQERHERSVSRECQSRLEDETAENEDLGLSVNIDASGD